MPICAPGFAEMMYQASLLPFGNPIARAKVSSGWTWMDNGSLVNSSLSSKAGVGAALSARSNHNSPTASPVRSMSLHGWRSLTPQGLCMARTEAYSMGMRCPDAWRARRGDVPLVDIVDYDLWLRRRVSGHVFLQEAGD